MDFQAPAGVEPTAFRLRGERSTAELWRQQRVAHHCCEGLAKHETQAASNLSHWQEKKKRKKSRHQQGSNLRPFAYEANALPLSYGAVAAEGLLYTYKLFFLLAKHAAAACRRPVPFGRGLGVGSGVDSCAVSHALVGCAAKAGRGRRRRKRKGGRLSA